MTIFPLEFKLKPKPKDFAKSLLYFPAVGLAIGFVLVSILFITRFLPSQVQAVIILITLIIITGGIHLDGFADSCDALFGTFDKNKMLKIMRDSRLGAMGVLGLVSLLLLKYAIIVSIPKLVLWKWLLVMPILGRWVQVIACYLSTYARTEGRAEYFIRYVGKKELLGAGLFALAGSLFGAGLNGVIVFLLTSVFSLGIIYGIKRKIDGMTGDTIGALNEFGELFAGLAGLILSGVIHA